jgi:uncharacterized protein (TIGR02687 family)
MSEQLDRALKRLFDGHRIVFWYDGRQELKTDFDAMVLDRVEKLEIANNEFGLKRRILREAPKQKFLLYHHGPRPANEDNWLLDVLLAHGELRTDQAAIWLSELGLGPEFADLVGDHAEFFGAEKRKLALKKLLTPEDVPTRIRLKMIAVCAGAEPRLDSVLEYLLQELADGRDEKMRLIERCGLDLALWKQLEQTFGYRSDNPGLRDFTVALFKSCYAHGTDGEVTLLDDARVFIKRWKDSRQFCSGFETLSEECAQVLGIENDLQQRDFRHLLELDYFELIERKILRDLTRDVAQRAWPPNEVIGWVQQRRESYWYARFADLYEALESAAGFIKALDAAELGMQSLADGYRRYHQSWHRLDFHYRKFIRHLRAAGQASLMSELTQQIENLYVNNYLLPINERWQAFVDGAERWEVPDAVAQRDFFARWVQPYLDKDFRICVVISDALRYEIGAELQRRILGEDRFDCRLEPMLAQLPSYTQLGMASLLPNQRLSLLPAKGAPIEVDGISATGTANRDKILKNALDGQAEALLYEQVMDMHRDDLRERIKAARVLYIYHNQVDRVGDKRDSEGQVCQAAEDAQEDLLKMVKKLTGNNVANILITADHGFIYQNRKLEESDFSSTAPEGELIFHQDRRFVTGRSLKDAPGFKRYSTAQLGLEGELEVQVSKSINRLRLKGSGSRFVHGGATLQEVVVPVLAINKKRASDVRQVEIDIVRTGSNTITTGQVAVMFYQTEPVTEKVQRRVLRAGIYTAEGELISDEHELIFDRASDNPRERELKKRFMLTREADSANEQEVFLRLNERHGDTSHFKEYKSVRYVIRRSFTTDFDF